MPSPIAEKTIEDAQRYGRAILKFISANDAGVTGSHQAGFYLPKSAWKLYAPFPPEQGRNDKSKVRIFWQSDRYTESVVTWYGKGNTKNPRSEYRLTCFGRDFPYLHEDMVGDLLVLVPQDLHNFLAYVIDLPDDVEDIQAALGVEVIGTWAVYEGAKEPEPISEDDCIDQQFRQFALNLTAFPAGDMFSAKARDALAACVRDFAKKPNDERLLLLMQNEYRLFKLVERQICLPEVRRLFKDIDDFLKTAATLMNRRKSRAGRSFENHVEYLLTEARIPFSLRPAIEGEPDIIIPSKDAYDDPSYPTEKLFMLGVKTTCKDRWRQVLQEAPRVELKHLITMQEGISAKQLADIYRHKLTLVVPEKLHTRYPKVAGVKLLHVEGFIRTVRKVLAT
jgi:type II restriction enzyme